MNGPTVTMRKKYIYIYAENYTVRADSAFTFVEISSEERVKCKIKERKGERDKGRRYQHCS